MSQNNSKNQSNQNQVKSQDQGTKPEAQEAAKAGESNSAISNEEKQELENLRIENAKLKEAQEAAKAGGSGYSKVETPIELDQNGKMTGNLDKKGEHPFDPSWSTGVVVRQVDVKKVDGEYLPSPKSARLAVYEPEVYDSLVRTKAFAGKQVNVLHDARQTIKI